MAPDVKYYCLFLAVLSLVNYFVMSICIAGNGEKASYFLISYGIFFTAIESGDLLGVRIIFCILVFLFFFALLYFLRNTILRVLIILIFIYLTVPFLSLYGV